MSKPREDMTAVFVGHGSAVCAMRDLYHAFGRVEKTERVDIIDNAETPRLDDEKHQKISKGLGRRNAVLILGLSEWTNKGDAWHSFDNPGDGVALSYAANSQQSIVRGTCLITDSLEKLDPILALKRENFEKRDKVRLVALYGEAGACKPRTIYLPLARRFPNLLQKDVLCVGYMNDIAARLIAAHIRNLV